MNDTTAQTQTAPATEAPTTEQTENPTQSGTAAPAIAESATSDVLAVSEGDTTENPTTTVSVSQPGADGAEAAVNATNMIESPSISEPAASHAALEEKIEQSAHLHIRDVLKEALAEIGKAREFTDKELDHLWKAVASKI